MDLQLRVSDFIHMRVHADCEQSVFDNRASHSVTCPTTVTPKRYRVMNSRSTAGFKAPLTEGLKSGVVQKFIARAFFHSAQLNQTSFLIYFYHHDAAAPGMVALCVFRVLGGRCVER
jgi:hypothetical protein